MKPGDHPDFFRFPAPAGRSRESSIFLDERGRFFHDGERIENQAMERAFFRWLRRHPEDGRFILSNGYDWTFVTVRGFPFFVPTISLVGCPTERIDLHVSDGTVETLRPETLRIDEEGALHCELERGERARWTPQAQAALGEVLCVLEREVWALRLGGCPVALPGLDLSRVRSPA